MVRGYSARLDWSDEDAAYIATSPEFPGLSGIDEDPNAALAELRDAIEMAIEVLEEDGELLPARRTLPEYSGQFRLRVPRSLHATLARQAEAEGISLNSYVTSLLAFAAGESQSQTEAAVALQRALTELREDLRGFRAPVSRSATGSSPRLADMPFSEPNADLAFAGAAKCLPT